MTATLIALEGIDGSGKATQAELLRQAAEAEDIHAIVISFPRYKETLGGKIIGQYLNGDFGPLSELNPILTALPYALDRFESLPFITRARNEYDLIIFDRYVASNFAYQAARLPFSKRQQFLNHISFIEHSLFNAFYADVTYWLDIPTNVAQYLIREKRARLYTDKKEDIHEIDFELLQEAANIYNTFVQNGGYLSIWRRITCCSPIYDTKLVRHPDSICQEIWKDLKARVSLSYRRSRVG